MIFPVDGAPGERIVSHVPGFSVLVASGRSLDPPESLNLYPAREIPSNTTHTTQTTLFFRPLRSRAKQYTWALVTLLTMGVVSVPFIAPSIANAFSFGPLAPITSVLFSTTNTEVQEEARTGEYTGNTSFISYTARIHSTQDTPALRAALNSDPNPAKGGGDITIAWWCRLGTRNWAIGELLLILRWRALAQTRFLFMSFERAIR